MEDTKDALQVSNADLARKNQTVSDQSEEIISLEQELTKLKQEYQLFQDVNLKEKEGLKKDLQVLTKSKAQLDEVKHDSDIIYIYCVYCLVSYIYILCAWFHQSPSLSN